MINSITKNRIDRESINRVILSALGETPSDISELNGGMFNAAYLVELNRANRYVLKVAPSPEVRLLHYEKDLIHTELLTLKLLEKKTSLPVPHVVYASQKGEELGGAPWFIMDYIEGTPYNKIRKELPREIQETISHQLGAYLKEMNSIRGPLFGYPGIPEEQSQMWEEAFPAMLEGVLKDGSNLGITLPLGYDEIRRLAEKDYSALSEITLPSLIHWDLWEGNVFVNNGKVSGIIDCERALWADPLMEHNFSSVSGLVPAFFEGYGRKPPHLEGEIARRRLYDLYLFLIMVIETYYRRFEPNEQIKWSYPLLENFLISYPH